MLTTIKGRYKDGRIVLDEDPGVSGESPRMVTFYAIDDDIAKKEMMTNGMLAVSDRPMSTLEDFQIAEHNESRKRD
jgi:hypothetical protein